MACVPSVSTLAPAAESVTSTRLAQPLDDLASPATPAARGRLARGLIVGATSIGLVLGAATTASAAPAASSDHRATAADRLSGRVAAGWLSRQFVDGTHLTTDFGGTSYADPGLTLDAVLAFAATKTNDVRAAKALTWLADGGNLTAYAGSGTDESYAGAHAKLVLALQVRGQNARAYGGRDILGELQSLQRADGRLSDRSTWGDYSNAFGQSFGVIAFKRAGLPAANRAVGYLAGQACADGGVPITFEQATCTGDRDATALAIQAFRATGRTTAASKAANWLRSAGAPTNANTAGLTAAALDLAGSSANASAADAARAYVRGLQNGCARPFARRGAIAFDASGFVPATAPRATTQAALGLTSANLATLTSAGSIAYAPTLACS